MAIKSIQDSRQLLRALEDLSNVTQFLEQKFADELYVFFQYLGRKVLDNVDLEDPLSAIFYQQANGVIQEHWKEYDEILKTYIGKAAYIGVVYHKILLNASKQYSKNFESLKSINPDDLKVTMDVWEREELFASNPMVQRILEVYDFEASEKTMNRVTSDINKVLLKGYSDGWGHYDIAKQLKEKFTQLSTYESRRIAQTEINSTRNYAQFNALLDDEMEYKIWMAAKDSRVRPSHKKVDREIVPINETFSNGLMYAGDKDGNIKEWINCRCSIAAYIIPQGYQAPAFFPFKEKDLVKVSENPKPTDFTDGYEHPTIATGVDLNGHRLLSAKEIIEMDFTDLAHHHDAFYQGVFPYEGKKYHKFLQRFDNDKTLTLYFEDKAVKSYAKKGWVHPNEIVDEVFKVPDTLKRQTDEIWFKDTKQGINKKWNGKYDTMKDKGYNLRYLKTSLMHDPQHRIILNPSFFKGYKGRDYIAAVFEEGGTPYGGANNWKKTLHYEFAHSIDWSREMYQKDGVYDDDTISWTDQYTEVHNAERWFTPYANTQRTESFAEHMGYVSRMLANPDEQNLKIGCKYKDPDLGIVDGNITFEEYKLLYPKHFEFCRKLLMGEYTMQDFYPDN